MEILIKAAQFFLSLSILVILHEFGHFAFAKLFKTRVEKFYLFFDPWFSIFKFKKGDTEYGMGWLPLGGYVKIAGMIDESMDKEQLKKEPQPYEFRAKPTWQRLFIMIGGVAVNFVLAIVIYASILFAWGEEYLPTKNLTYGIMTDSLTHEMGLKNGDKIVSVDGQEVKDFMLILPEIALNKASSIQVIRDGKQIDVEVNKSVFPKLLKSKGLLLPRVPFYAYAFSDSSVAEKAGMKKGDQLVKIDTIDVPYYDQFTGVLKNYIGETISIGVIREGKEMDIEMTVPEIGKIGVYADFSLSKFFELEHIEYTFWEAIPAGINMGIDKLGSYVKQLKLLFDSETEAYKSIGGFITIGSIFPGVWDWQAFWNLTALLSIILALMNILPIPALDGGHVMFLLYEIITGRKPSDKFLEYAQLTGMVILLSLLVFANGNDIIKLFN